MKNLSRSLFYSPIYLFGLFTSGKFLCPILLVLCAATWPPALQAKEIFRPNLIRDRSQERTGFQEAQSYNPKFDLQTDFVMPYGIRDDQIARLPRWKEAGYVLHMMTGSAWGSYQDYLDGKFDGRKHWDEAQVDAAGKPIMHNPTVPYMVPSVAFSRYLETGLKKAIDAGVVALHLEEPEFWARGGYSDSFKREWRIFYNEPWRRPDSSCDAQYRCSKLKHYLYRRTLDRLCASMKEYALVKHHRPVRFYVPTHSLLNYTQWRIVSPESALIDLPGVDGYIAQVWTGTARTPNMYSGRFKQRTFETAYLEYSCMQELVAGTGRRMWFLADPVEDNPRHDWNDYQTNYIKTLIASLLQPDVWRYEVSPWPSRVFLGKFPAGSPQATTIPADYATTLAVIFNQLGDMTQEDVSWPDSTEDVGLFLSDSAMFQRAAPFFDAGTTDDNVDDPLSPKRREIHNLTAFYGLALPILKRGIPLQTAQLDNIARTAGYLDRFKTLILSYEFQKPSSPGLHLALANWVARGGSLVYVGADTDPFKDVREWWNSGSSDYRAPAEHLFETLGLGRNPKQGTHKYGKGTVIVQRKHPAYYARSADRAAEFAAKVKEAIEAAGDKYIQRNSLLVRRGPYCLAAVMDESVDDKPLQIEGPLVDLLDPKLAVLPNVDLEPGKQGWYIDLKRVEPGPPMILAAAGRILSCKREANGITYSINTPKAIHASTRLLLPQKPDRVLIDEKQAEEQHWDKDSKTLLIRHQGTARPIAVSVQW